MSCRRQRRRKSSLEKAYKMLWNGSLKISKTLKACIKQIYKSKTVKAECCENSRLQNKSFENWMLQRSKSHEKCKLVSFECCEKNALKTRSSDNWKPWINCFENAMLCLWDALKKPW